MLDVELIDPAEVERAAAIFHRDGFVPIKDALNPEQLARIALNREQPALLHSK